LWLGDALVSSNGLLQAALDGLSKGDRSQRACRQTRIYGNLMEKMNALRTTDHLKVALVGLDMVSSH
jgi:hypothetical protein